MPPDRYCRHVGGFWQAFWHLRPPCQRNSNSECLWHNSESLSASCTLIAPAAAFFCYNFLASYQIAHSWSPIVWPNDRRTFSTSASRSCSWSSRRWVLALQDPPLLDGQHTHPGSASSWSPPALAPSSSSGPKAINNRWKAGRNRNGSHTRNDHSYCHNCSWRRRL